jgi:hypothetical protein
MEPAVRRHVQKALTGTGKSSVHRHMTLLRGTMIMKSNCQLEDHPLPAIHYHNSTPPPYLESVPYLYMLKQSKHICRQMLWSFRQINKVQPREPESSGMFTLSNHLEYCISNTKLEFFDTTFRIRVTLWVVVYRQSVRLGAKFLMIHDQVSFPRNKTLAVIILV